MLKLYTSPLSTFARRVHIAALEKGLQLESVVLDMAKREHRQAPYLALNPYGRVPTLVDGEFVLAESTAILEYLEARFPEPALLPSGVRERAQVAMHMKLCDLELAAPNYTTIFSKRFVPQERWRAAEMEAAKKPTERHLAILDKHLEGRSYLVAERFTLADLCYVPFLHFRALLDVEIPANVSRWADALLERASAKATVPPL
jgi:glutathione S-transferase